MERKKIIPIILSAALLLGCGLQSSGHNEELTQEELERQSYTNRCSKITHPPSRKTIYPSFSGRFMLILL